MQLDVIIPTYNRADLLKLTLQSLLAAEIPAGLSVRVTVVDNNSTDQTYQTVSAFQPLFAGRLNYLFERKQGRSSALNAGNRHKTMLRAMDSEEFHFVKKSWQMMRDKGERRNDFATLNKADDG